MGKKLYGNHLKEDKESDSLFVKGMDKYGKKYVISNYLGTEKSTLIQRILNLSAGNLIQNRPRKQGPWDESYNCVGSNNRYHPNAFSCGCPFLSDPLSKIYIFLSTWSMTLCFHNLSTLLQDVQIRQTSVLLQYDIAVPSA